MKAPGHGAPAEWLGFRVGGVAVPEPRDGEAPDVRVAPAEAGGRRRTDGVVGGGRHDQADGRSRLTGVLAAP
jgi:hypothetical protein